MVKVPQKSSGCSLVIDSKEVNAELYGEYGHVFKEPIIVGKVPESYAQERERTDSMMNITTAIS